VQTDRLNKVISTGVPGFNGVAKTAGVDPIVLKPKLVM
jgi:hypothetical protein